MLRVVHMYYAENYITVEKKRKFAVLSFYYGILLLKTGNKLKLSAYADVLEAKLKELIVSMPEDINSELWKSIFRAMLYTIDTVDFGAFNAIIVPFISSLEEFQ